MTHPGAQTVVSGTQQHAGGNAQITTTNYHYGNTIIGESQTSSDPISRLQQHATLGALHNAAERSEPPRCHEGTRIVVLASIDEWARDDSLDAKSILWLKGAAGAGKSAICQTLVERWRNDNHIVPNFFLWRTAAKRNQKTYIIPTIAFQLTKLLPSTKPIIEEAVRDDSIFEGDFKAQVEALIIQPLKKANIDNRLVVIVVDGLDECCADIPSTEGYPGQIHEDQQREILEALAFACDELRSLRVLIASRPEHQIRKSFTVLLERVFLLSLNNGRHAIDSVADITLYLGHEFARIRSGFPELGTLWPSGQQMNDLIEKSSGQFIYPSLVVKYISRSRKHPRNSLKEVLALHPIKGIRKTHPLAELDALYTLVLKTVSNDSRSTVMTLLGLMTYYLEVGDFHPLRIFRKGKSGYNKACLEKYLFLEDGDLSTHLTDLHSILSISEDRRTDIGFFHATLSEYLQDESRSGEFFISKEATNLQISLALLKHGDAENEENNESSPNGGVYNSSRLYAALAHWTNNSLPSVTLKEHLWRYLTVEIGEYPLIASSSRPTSTRARGGNNPEYLQGRIFLTLDTQMSCWLLEYLQRCNVAEIEPSRSRRYAVGQHLAYLLHLIDPRRRLASKRLPRLNA